MAYEALIAERNYIAQEAFKAWQTGEDTDTIIERMEKESNIDAYIIRAKLIQLINDSHLNRKLQGY